LEKQHDNLIQFESIEVSFNCPRRFIRGTLEYKVTTTETHRQLQGYNMSTRGMLTTPQKGVNGIEFDLTLQDGNTPDMTAVSSPTSSSTTAVLPSDLLSSQIVSLYEQTLQKLRQLREDERRLSAQSGQLLKALQNDEAIVTILNNSLKRIRTEHKNMLNRIAAPRWEVHHHYHMTCMEHSLGHRQPHVMDVAEMLPGHLRLYAISRCQALIKRGLSTSTSRAKAERNQAAAQIKEGYRQLRDVRQEKKELQKLIEAMNSRLHILSPEEREKVDAIVRHYRKQQAISNSSSGRSLLRATSAGLSGSSPHANVAGDIRMRYLKTLNLAPRQWEVRSEVASEEKVREEKIRVADTYNREWKQMMFLFHSLEQQRNAAATNTQNNTSPIPNTEEKHLQRDPNEFPAHAIQTRSDSTTILPTHPENAIANVTNPEHAQSPMYYSDVESSDDDNEVHLVKSYRRRMGLVSLPSPLAFDDDPNNDEEKQEDANNIVDESGGAIEGMANEFQEFSFHTPSSPYSCSPSLQGADGSYSAPASPVSTSVTQSNSPTLFSLTSNTNPNNSRNIS
jgi:hypothetical protein